MNTVLNKFNVSSLSDWGRSSWPYWIYAKCLYTYQGYKKNVFEATKILDGGLWVGNLCSVFDKEELKNNGIDTVVTAVYGAKAPYPFDFNYQRANLMDKEGEDIIGEFDRLLPIIHQDLMSGKGVILTCVEGRSRSVSLCAAYMIKHHGYSVDEALEYIKERRSCIKPNEGYVRQLREFEEIIRSEKLVKSE